MLLRSDMRFRCASPGSSSKVATMHLARTRSLGAYQKRGQLITEYLNIPEIAWDLGRTLYIHNLSVGVLLFVLITQMRGGDFTRSSVSGVTTVPYLKALFSSEHSHITTKMLSFYPAESFSAEQPDRPRSMNTIMHVELNYTLFRRFCEVAGTFAKNKRPINDDELRANAATLVWTLYMMANCWKLNTRELDCYATIRQGGVDRSLYGYAMDSISGKCQYASQVATMSIYSSNDANHADYLMAVPSEETSK